MSRICLFGMVLVILNLINSLEAKEIMKPLNDKEQKIVEISMYTARGKMPELKTALAAGLDAGLTVNEIREVLVQLYAYCGFPRSLNALGNFMTLLNERKTAGIHDASGKDPGPSPQAEASITARKIRQNSAEHRFRERFSTSHRQSTNF